MYPPQNQQSPEKQPPQKGSNLPNTMFQELFSLRQCACTKRINIIQHWYIYIYIYYQYIPYHTLSPTETPCPWVSIHPREWTWNPLTTSNSACARYSSFADSAMMIHQHLDALTRETFRVSRILKGIWSGTGSVVKFEQRGVGSWRNSIFKKRACWKGNFLSKQWFFRGDKWTTGDVLVNFVGSRNSNLPPDHTLVSNGEQGKELGGSFWLRLFVG